MLWLEDIEGSLSPQNYLLANVGRPYQIYIIWHSLVPWFRLFLWSFLPGRRFVRMLQMHFLVRMLFHFSSVLISQRHVRGPLGSSQTMWQDKKPSIGKEIWSLLALDMSTHIVHSGGAFGNHNMLLSVCAPLCCKNLCSTFLFCTGGREAEGSRSKNLLEGP